MTLANLASPLRLTLLGTLLGFNIAAQAAPAPAAISFDTTPRAGQHQRQLIDLKAVMKMRVEAAPEATDEQRAKIAQAAQRMSQMGPMKFSTQMEQTMKVEQADAEGWLPLTVSIASKGGSMEMGGKAIPMPDTQAMNASYSARFNPKDFSFDFQQVQSSSPQLAEAMKAQGSAMINESLQLFKALSQRPLKVGDSVDVPVTMALPVPLPGGAGAMQGNVRYTLARVDRGVAHFDLNMDLKMDISAPLPSAPASAASAASDSAGAAAEPAKTLQMQIGGSGKGTASLRLADRLPLASRLAMDMKMTMNGPDNGRMLMDMDMVVVSKGESLAKPAAAKTPAKKKP
ncbi:hypothetical protein [Roseateles sp. LYH14W]|uniref:DUF2125 domain-containing protein n=1 Tax=Pelomonas parva TaxID=3299032 RepID=A0ABW7F5R1_9BURK